MSVEVNVSNRFAPTKRCTGCLRVFPRSHFSPRKGGLYVVPKCKECCSSIAKAWREANPERHSANYSKWATADPERHAKRLRDWRAIKENAQKHRDWSKRWARLNPEQRKAIEVAGRARRRNAKTTIVSAADLRKMLDLQGSRCYYCQEPLAAGMHLEHRTPIIRGGQHTLENLCWSCPTCNLRKGRKTEAEFSAWIGRAA